MFFCAKTQGFYVGDELDKNAMPVDCLEVTSEQEEEIREEIMKGNIVSVENGNVVSSPRS